MSSSCQHRVRRGDSGLSFTEGATPDYRRRGGCHAGDSRHRRAVDDRSASGNRVCSTAGAARTR